jgi:hypothetical protein
MLEIQVRTHVDMARFKEERPGLLPRGLQKAEVKCTDFTKEFTSKKSRHISLNLELQEIGGEGWRKNCLLLLTGPCIF